MRRRLLLLAVGTLLAAARFAQAGDDAHDEHGEHHEHAGHALEGAAPSDHSLYRLPGSWSDQNARPFELEALRGSPVLLALFYGTCDSVCPVIVRDMQKVEAMLSPDDRRRTRFVLVTIDPKVDTPDKLLAYAKKHEMDPARWTLLTGPPEQVRVLANVLGFKYRPTGTGQYSHTIRIHVLDREGVVVDHADGLERPLEPIAARVSALLASEAPGK
jgi:protein SCO1/2